MTNRGRERVTAPAFYFHGRCKTLQGTSEYIFNVLIAGQRRIEAAKSLGWSEIPATVIDLEDVVKGEHAENVERLDFTASEKVAIAEAIEVIEKSKAKERKSATQFGGGGNLPPPKAQGKTRDLVAKAVGLSGKTYEKAKAIVKAAEREPAKYKPLQAYQPQTATRRDSCPVAASFEGRQGYMAMR